MSNMEYHGITLNGEHHIIISCYATTRYQHAMVTTGHCYVADSINTMPVVIRHTLGYQKRCLLMPARR